MGLKVLQNMELLKALMDLDKIKKIKRALKKDSLLIESVSEGAKILIAEIFSRDFPKILWVVKDGSRVDFIANYLREFSKNQIVKFLPTVDEKNHDELIARKENLLKILSSKKQIIIAPTGAIFQKIAGSGGQKIRIFQNRPCSFSYLAKKLSDAGFERTEKVILPGDFALHGGNFDIFPVGSKDPIRIEFLGSAVQQIFTFNILTGDRIKKLNKSLIIEPIMEKKFTKNLTDLLPKNTLIILDEPQDLAENLISLSLLNPQIPSWKKMIKKLLKFKKIYFESLIGFGPQIKRINLGWHKPAVFFGNLERINFEYGSYKIFVLSNEFKNLEKSKHFEFCKIRLPEGLIISEKKWVILTQSEIFGPIKESQAVSKISKKDLEFLENLNAGDLVVHFDHGIGRFKKIASLELRTKKGKILGDYIFLEFAKGDKLYLPKNQVAKLSRYVGVAGIKPALSRLGTGGWLRIKKRVSEQALKFARELLEIAALREKWRGFAFRRDEEWEKKIESSFEYEETAAQKKAIWQVYKDMEKDKPMDRLICGDVGFGKTEVAVRAALRAVSSGKQVAIICPTTILAEQHFVTFQKRLADFPLKIERLSRFLSKSKQKEIIQKLSQGLIDIIIGTHRLLSQDISFFDLGLVIIDEEQRFGVKAKEKLKRLRAIVDILTLTATPIPRTLFMTLSGLKNISTIDTPPEGRLPIITRVSKIDPKLIKNAVIFEKNRGGQIYFVYNRVRGIWRIYQELKNILPKNIKIGIAHGQQDTKTLAETMNNFTQGKIDLLLTTTIIENGLDLPNVNTLIVCQAEKFGLADLYQLRGRIGRGTQQAYAYFLVSSHKITRQARKRLSAVLEAKDLGSGYQIALRDLEIRGGGNILGKEQHGNMAAVGLNLYTQLLAEAIEKVKEEL